jgi:hypothetical protein
VVGITTLLLLTFKIPHTDKHRPLREKVAKLQSPGWGLNIPRVRNTVKATLLEWNRIGLGFFFFFNQLNRLMTVSISKWTFNILMNIMVSNFY